jgi:hypothetical protein
LASFGPASGPRDAKTPDERGYPQVTASRATGRRSS